MLRNSDGSENITGTEVLEVDQILIREALARANEIFEPIGFEFFQLGEPNYIDHDLVRSLSSSYRQYSYVSSALNIVIGGSNNNGITGSASMPSGFPASRNYSNTLWLKSGNELLGVHLYT